MKIERKEGKITKAKGCTEEKEEKKGRKGMREKMITDKGGNERKRKIVKKKIGSGKQNAEGWKKGGRG